MCPKLNLEEAVGAVSGQVYTEGNFSVDKITVLGSFLANSQAPGGSLVTLQDARVAHDPRHLAMNITIQPPAPTPVVAVPAGPLPPDPVAALDPLFSVSAPLNGMGNASVPVVMMLGGQLVNGSGESVGGVAETAPGDSTTLLLADETIMHVSVIDGLVSITDAEGNPSNSTLIDPALIGVGAYASGSLSEPVVYGPPPEPGASPTAGAATPVAAMPPPVLQTVSFEFNQFLAPQDKIRVLLWREL